jgi:hypothetical protein
MYAWCRQPISRKIGFSACRLQCLNAAEADDRCGKQFAEVHLHAHGRIGSCPLEPAQDKKVQQRVRNVLRSLLNTQQTRNGRKSQPRQTRRLRGPTNATKEALCMAD